MELEVSLVVETYTHGEGSALERTAKALGAAADMIERHGAAELLVADSSGDPELAALLAGRFPRARRIDLVGLGYDEAKMKAAAESRGRFVLYLAFRSPAGSNSTSLQLRRDAVATGGFTRYDGGFLGALESVLDFGFLLPATERPLGWLEALERRLSPDVDAVAGAIVNGTPESAAGTSGFLLEFPEDMWPGEDTVLTFRVAGLGRLQFAPAARVHHLNRTQLRQFLAHQFRLGRSFAEVCRRVELSGRGLARLPFAPLLGVARVPKLWLRLHGWRSLPRRHLAVLPLVSLGAVVWTAGLTWDAFGRAVGRRPQRSQELVVTRDADHRRLA